MIDLKTDSVKESNAVLGSDINSRFNEIYDSTNKSILAFITAKCGNTSDINDIFQNTYMELYQMIKKYGATYVIDGKAYVFRIAKRKIAQHYSLIKRLKMFVSMNFKDEDNEKEEIKISNADIDSFLTLTEECMEDYVVNNMLLENARRFIQQKPIDIRKIFYLYYDVGLSIPEIAQKLSLNKSSVKNKLYRTVKEIQILLEKEGNHNENEKI